MPTGVYVRTEEISKFYASCALQVYRFRDVDICKCSDSLVLRLLGRVHD